MANGLARAIGVFYLGAVISNCFAQTVPAHWIGDYSYQYVMGHAPGSLAPAWTFNLAVKKDGSCELTWQGYQKDDDIFCKVSGEKDELRIFFLEFADGSTSDPSGTQKYKPGAELLTLKLVGANRMLWTKWRLLNEGHVLKDGERFERD